MQHATITIIRPCKDCFAFLYAVCGATFGVEPIRADLLNHISGVGFEEAWKNKIRGKYGNVEVNFIGRVELIKNKSSTDRPKDKLDVDELSR